MELACTFSSLAEFFFLQIYSVQAAVIRHSKGLNAWDIIVVLRAVL